MMNAKKVIKKINESMKLNEGSQTSQGLAEFIKSKTVTGSSSKEAAQWAIDYCNGDVQKAYDLLGELQSPTAKRYASGGYYGAVQRIVGNR